MTTEQRIRQHKFVEFTYSIVDETGNLLEQVDIPVSYVHGADNGMFEKIENAMEGRGCNERVQVTLSPDEGFGRHQPELTYTDDINNVPEQFRQIGAEVEMMNDRGESKTFIVTKIDGGKLTVDGNHPLAGKQLTFTLTIQTIRDASEEEIAQGRPGQDQILH